jgi:hypothetical protein
MCERDGSRPLSEMSRPDPDAVAEKSANGASHAKPSPLGLGVSDSERTSAVSAAHSSESEAQHYGSLLATMVTPN